MRPTPSRRPSDRPGRNRRVSLHGMETAISGRSGMRSIISDALIAVREGGAGKVTSPDRACRNNATNSASLETTRAALPDP